MADKCKECGKELHFYNKAIGKYKGLCSGCAMKENTAEFKKAGKEVTPEAIKKFVNVTDERTFAKSLDSVYEACVQTVNKLGWKIKSQSKSKLECEKGMSLTSAGSDITITLGKSGGGIKVNILSRDKWGAMGSLGGNLKSKKNIKTFFEDVEKRLLLMK